MQFSESCNNVVGFSTINLHNFIWEKFFELITNTIEAIEYLIPINGRFISIFFTMCFIVWKVIFAPIVFIITTDNHFSIFISKSRIVQSNTIQDHMANQSLIYLLLIHS